MEHSSNKTRKENEPATFSRKRARKVPELGEGWHLEADNLQCRVTRDSFKRHKVSARYVFKKFLQNRFLKTGSKKPVF